jgi:hypothetical protein
MMHVVGERAPSCRCLWLWSAWVLVAAVFTANGYRALSQSITHDEAITYNSFVDAPLRHLVTHFDANNHLLNSLLCRVTTAVCGTSELTLRFPSLCGGLLYLCVVVALCRYALGNGPIFLLAVAALVLNPFVLDYLSVARGYGLALGLFLCGLYQLVRYLGDVTAEAAVQVNTKRLPLAATLLALAVFASLTFAVIVVATAAVFVILVLVPAKVRERRTNAVCTTEDLWRHFVRPAVAWCAVLAIFVFKARPHHFYVGEESLRSSFLGLIDASFAHDGPPWPWSTNPAALAHTMDGLATWGAPLFLALVAALCGQTVWTWRRHGWDPCRVAKQDWLLLFWGGTLLLALATLVALHSLLGMKYPQERTGIYLCPMIGLVGIALVARWLRDKRQRIGVAILAGVLLLSLTAQFAVQFTAGPYRTWRYDAASRRVFDTVQQTRGDGEGQQLTVACHWLNAPSLEFYRRMYRATWLKIVPLGPAAMHSDHYVLPLTGVHVGQPLTTAFRDETAQVMVCTAARPRDWRQDENGELPRH